MKKLFYYSFMLVYLCGMCACDSSTEEAPPSAVISEDSMVEVMADVHLTEARLLNAGYRSDQLGLKSGIIQATLAENGVDTARFNRSFDWYSLHPAVFSRVYDEVLNELSRRQAKLKQKSGPAIN